MPILGYGEGNGPYSSLANLTRNQSIVDYRRMMNSLEDENRNTTEVIVTRFQSREVDWGMPHTNTRGLYILEWVARMDLLILNVGYLPKFCTLDMEKRSMTYLSL